MTETLGRRDPLTDIAKAASRVGMEVVVVVVSMSNRFM
jgi:hypothetical protein